MTLWNLDDDAISQLLGLPETGMGFQWVTAQALGRSTQFLVLNSQAAVDLTGIELQAGAEPAIILANGLRVMEALRGIEPTRTIFSAPAPKNFVLLGTRVGDPAAQVRPAVATPQVAQASTLVKKTKLAARRTFHRYSAFNPDRRIDPATGSLLPGSYAVPDSEVSFIPTGFAAVGRLALPNVNPASNHYVIEAAAGTFVEFGTVARAFGQAGGGVEAFFVFGATNTQLPPAAPLRIPDE